MQQLGAGAIVYGDDVDTLAYDWGNIKIVSAPEVTGGTSMTFGLVVLNPGKGHDRHAHDADEVRVFLRTVAGRVAELEERIEALRSEVTDLEAREPQLGDLDSGQVSAAIGHETARVLEAAREAAAEIRSKGEESVGRLLREARDEATAVREESGQLRREAQDEASALTAEAEETAEAIRIQGQDDADRMMAEA